jgi:poly [ADP-ribose] polymerase
MLAKISRQIVDEAYKLILVPTKDEINEARNLLVKLSNTNEVGSFNEILMDLFGLIPRKMRNPILFTAKDKESFAEIIDRENTLLDNLEIVTDSMEASGDKGGMIDFSDCNEEENRMVYEMLDNATKKKFSKVYKVSNRYSDNDFEKYVKEKSIKSTKLLFHGSRTENWFSIIKTGLSVSPINVVITGKMFGNGIYFAPKADKANGYTSLKGSRWAKGNTDTAYMGIFEVATGHEFLTDDWEHRYTEITAQNKKRFIGNCDSFHALAGKHLLNDEIIVYDKNAARIRYLVELKCK